MEDGQEACEGDDDGPCCQWVAVPADLQAGCANGDGFCKFTNYPLLDGWFAKGDGSGYFQAGVCDQQTADCDTMVAGASWQAGDPAKTCDQNSCENSEAP